MDVLCEAYAQDSFGIQELERRLDEANRAGSEAELQALVADLRIPEALAPTQSSTGASVSRREELAGRLPTDPVRVPNRQLSVGFWSGRVRRGSWVPARRVTAVAFQGGVELDFREALFGSDVVEVRAIAVMGGIHIVVPPNLHVETSGLAIMGGLEDRTELDSRQVASGPVLKIVGFACMGAINIDVRLPGETPREARRRRKKKRQAKRG